jgi:hypothetical protein
MENKKKVNEAIKEVESQQCKKKAEASHSTAAVDINDNKAADVADDNGRRLKTVKALMIQMIILMMIDNDVRYLP